MKFMPVCHLAQICGHLLCSHELFDQYYRFKSQVSILCKVKKIVEENFAACSSV